MKEFLIILFFGVLFIGSAILFTVYTTPKETWRETQQRKCREAGGIPVNGGNINLINCAKEGYIDIK